MIARLRSVGPWTNVDVHFEEDWVGGFINHFRIVAKPPFGAMGLPVVAHLVEQTFVM
jgi:hypothetical protein